MKKKSVLAALLVLAVAMLSTGVATAAEGIYAGGEMSNGTSYSKGEPLFSLAGEAPVAKVTVPAVSVAIETETPKATDGKKINFLPAGLSIEPQLGFKKSVTAGGIISYTGPATDYYTLGLGVYTPNGNTD